MTVAGIPTEVQLVFEVMNCQASQVAQTPITTPSSCNYFRKWGTYHSFEYAADEQDLEAHMVDTTVEYVGRAPLVPEILTGCRKSPIMAVGINPNLPGWWATQRGALNPLFRSFRDYAHYFRYRGSSKLRLDEATYLQYGGGPGDDPFSTVDLAVPVDSSGRRMVQAERAPQAMYLAYQGLLDDLATARGWPAGALTVGEDLSYGNMIASPSAKWTTHPDAGVPAMTETERIGIVTECFRNRRYFLRQLFQSLPRIILVFSQSTTNAFVGEMAQEFSVGHPQHGEPVTDLLKREIRLTYGHLSGLTLDARVIFAPHPTGDPDAYTAVHATLVDQLTAEVQTTGITLNPDTGHLHRAPGRCEFCSVFDIGGCGYLNELAPLPGAEPTATAARPTVNDSAAASSLLISTLIGQSPVRDIWRVTDDD